jgi:hypothetical protein
LEDAKISMAMLWQSYPIFWMVVGLIVAVLFFRWMYRRMHWTVYARTEGHGIPNTKKWFLISGFAAAGLCVWQHQHIVIKMEKSFELNDNFKSYLSLNPLQNFFTTLRLRSHNSMRNTARENFSVMADWMGLQNKNDFSYRREVFPEIKALESRPNVVLVMCESFSMYKSSMSGNPLNTCSLF